MSGRILPAVCSFCSCSGTQCYDLIRYENKISNTYTNFTCTEMTKVRITFSYHLCHSINVLPILAAVRRTSLSAYLVNVSCAMHIYDTMTRHLKVKGEN